MTRGVYLTAAVATVPSSPDWARVWLVDLDAVVADESILTVTERARAGRFVFDRDRRRFVAARGVLRTLLVQQAGAELPGDFDLGEEGKPFLPHPGAPSFNLSHSGRYALIAISETHEVGADIEEFKPVGDLEALAEHHFTVRERSMWSSDGPDGSRLACFLRGWTRKEACLKALGAGLTIDTRTFEAELAAGVSRVRVPVPEGVTALRVAEVDVGPGLLAAVACVDRDTDATGLPGRAADRFVPVWGTVAG